MDSLRTQPLMIHDPSLYILKSTTSSTRTQRREMKQTLVRLKLLSKRLAHIELHELHQHLEAEVSKLNHEFALDDAAKLLGMGVARFIRTNADTGTGDLVFLLSSPLFIYAIGPRVQSANTYLHNLRYGPSESSASTAIQARYLRIIVGHDGSC